MNCEYGLAECPYLVVKDAGSQLPADQWEWICCAPEISPDYCPAFQYPG